MFDLQEAGNLYIMKEMKQLKAFLWCVGAGEKAYGTCSRGYKADYRYVTDEAIENCIE